MRVIFICGSLTPGQDGVGDYTRQLAKYLVTKGHQCLLISLCDNEAYSEELNDDLTVLRHTNVLNEANKQHNIRSTVANWKPDLISLQFVCFAFNPKGLIRQFIPLLESITWGAPLQIMFHELWLGEQPDLPFKHKLLGFFQKRQILVALKRCRPICIHTSNRLYQMVLSAEGITSARLPIFGNVPIVSTAQTKKRHEPKVRKLVFPFSPRNDWNVVESMSRLQTLAANSGLTFEIIQVGRLRNDANHWDYIQEFCKTMDWPCQMLGKQNAAEISRVLQSADIGICAAHPALADKSGAAVAMLEHGLPVICTITKPVSNRFINLPVDQPNLYSFFDDERKLLELIKHPVKGALLSRLPAIATQWEDDIRHNLDA